MKPCKICKKDSETFDGFHLENGFDFCSSKCIAEFVGKFPAQNNPQDIGFYLISLCFNYHLKEFKFTRKESKRLDYQASILLLGEEFEKLKMMPCDQCKAIAVFTVEGPNPEYSQTLCSKCEATKS